MTAFRLSALAIAATLGWSAAAQAQTPAPPPGAGAPGWGPEAKQHMRERFEAHRAEHVKALHDALNIRPDQEAAFQAFIAARKPEPGQWGKPGGPKDERAELAGLTTPERLDRIEHEMAEHDARRHDAFERMAAATKALYAALSPEQKRTFDALPHLIGGHHHEGPGGDHGPHGGPEGPGERG